MSNIGKELGKVLYFDPNNTSGDVNNDISKIFDNVDRIKPPEDYCVAVDLEVTTKYRTTNSLNTDGKTYRFSMTDGAKISNFLGGSNKGGTNVLTSFFTDITFSGDEPEVVSEAMGIESIDIDFNSWYVPTVIIKFIDTRGASLFSPTEYIANLSGAVDKKISDGNIFGGFFTMPYPIYKLKVKGFYGDSVTYPLHCVDFKAELNDSTGNFEITANFIGYTYAMLSDIEVLYLMAAPYTKNYGESYWETNVKNGRFTSAEGTPLPKLSELLKNIKKGENVIKTIESSDPNSQEVIRLQSEYNSISNIKNLIDSYVTMLRSNTPFGFSIVESNNYKLKLIDSKTPITEDFKDNEIFKNKITSITDAIKVHISTYTNSTVFINYKDEKGVEYFKVKNISKTVDLKYNADVDLTEIIKTIDNFNKEKENKSNSLEERVAATKTDRIIETYQVVPSIFNFTKILLAHTETFMHVIAACADEIVKNGDRGSLFTSNQETDFKDNKLLPFPWFTIDNQDEWIGKYYPELSEVKLVDSFIKAQTLVKTDLESSEVYRVEQNITTQPIKSLWRPINAFDNSIVGIGDKTFKPYSNLVKENGLSISELKHILSTRIATIVGLTMDKTKDVYYDSFILAESDNILNEFNDNEDYLNRVITALNSIIKESQNNEKYTSLRSYSDNNKITNKYEYKLFGTKEILPLTDDTVTTLESNILNGKVSQQFNYYKYFTSTGETDDKYYPSTVVKFVDGRENCDSMLNNWFIPIKDMEPKVKKIRNLNADKVVGYGTMQTPVWQFSNSAETDIVIDKSLDFYNLTIDNSSNSINNEIVKLQPLSNMVVYKKPIYNDDSKNFYNSVGFGDINYKAELDINEQNKDIQQFIFKNNNKTSEIFRLYAGQTDYMSAKYSDIEKDLNRIDMFKNKKPLIGDLTYPFVGGNYENLRINAYQQPERFIDKKIIDLLRTDPEDKFNHITSLFGDNLYYAQNVKRLNESDEKYSTRSNNSKAYLFLQTLPITLKTLTKDLFDKKRSFMVRLPKQELLLLGSMLWRNKNSQNNEILTTDYFTYLPNKNQYFKVNGIFTITNNAKTKFDDCDLIDNILPHVADKIIAYFENWVTVEWPNIMNNFEIFKLNGDKYDNFTFKTLCEGFLSNSNVSYLNESVSSNVLLNYCVIEPIDNRRIGLLNRDGSEGVTNILNLYFEETVMAYTGDGIISYDSKNNIKPILIEFDVNRICNGIIEQLKKYKVPAPSTVNVNKVENNDDIKLQVYKYLKVMYDKWVSGYEFDTDNSEYKWIETTKTTKINNNSIYGIKNFKFIDRSYNDIGHKFLIDFNQVYETINSIVGNLSLYTLITNTLSKNQFLFLPMPNYQSWETVDDFAKIFKPIPYSESNISEYSGEWTSIFICMYTGNIARKLKINTDSYLFSDDSLDLDVTKNDEIPSDFSNDDEENGNDLMKKVPAFAVSYAKQNQSYFKKVNVSMTNPTVTEASIMALKNILDKADNTSKINTIGQDLYSIYSEYAYTCDVEMMGCPQIQPMMYFQLTNVPMWNGAYLIYKIKHSIRPGYMVTNFTGMKMGKSYPKLLQTTVVSYDKINLGGDLGIKEIKPTLSTLSMDTKIGKYFTLGQYVGARPADPILQSTNIGAIQIPSNGVIAPPVTTDVVSKIQYNLAITIDKIYDEWMKSPLNKKYGKFNILVGYSDNYNNKNAVDETQHKLGLAADIQLINNSEEGNLALFNVIKAMMRGGLKMDQLVREGKNNSNGAWVHVSPVREDNGYIEVRGQVIDNYLPSSDSKYFTVIEEAKNATINGDLSGWESRFIEYWKNCENNKTIKSGGWNKDRQLWFAHDSVEGGDKTISYGIKLTTGFLESQQMKSYPLVSLQNGTIGITDDIAINEIRVRAKSSISFMKKTINSRYGNGTFEKILPKYVYAMVDICLNHGIGNWQNKEQWKKFTEAAKNNDLKTMLIYSDRGDATRTDKFIKFLNSN